MSKELCSTTRAPLGCRLSSLRSDFNTMNGMVQLSHRVLTGFCNDLTLSTGTAGTQPRLVIVGTLLLVALPGRLVVHCNWKAISSGGYPPLLVIQCKKSCREARMFFRVQLTCRGAKGGVSGIAGLRVGGGGEGASICILFGAAIPCGLQHPWQRNRPWLQAYRSLKKGGGGGGNSASRAGLKTGKKVKLCMCVQGTGRGGQEGAGGSLITGGGGGGGNGLTQASLIAGVELTVCMCVQGARREGQEGASGEEGGAGGGGDKSQ